MTQFMGEPNPRLSEAYRTKFVANADAIIDFYCPCVVNALPLRSMPPGTVPYIAFFLPHVIQPREREEAQMLMKEQGLNDDRMTVIVHRFYEETERCDYDKYGY